MSDSSLIEELTLISEIKREGHQDLKLLKGRDLKLLKGRDTARPSSGKLPKFDNIAMRTATKR